MSSFMSTGCAMGSGSRFEATGTRRKSEKSRGARRGARHGMCRFSLAAAIALCGVPLLGGCDRLAEALTVVVGAECANLIRVLFEQPVERLPQGYVLCQTHEWTRKSNTAKFCLYCDPEDELKVYVQLNCEGDYYPMQTRRLLDTTPTTTKNGTTLSAFDCTVRFYAASESTCNLNFTWCMGQFETPDDRVLPSIAGYTDLALYTDGHAIKAAVDTPIAGGTLITIEGGIDQVAHYAMTLGVEEFSVTDTDDHYEVFLNREFSAIMVFKNDAFMDCRLLFAPEQ